ncbi:MAG: ACT domain-containing protein [Actinobacteria bacterium]|nr:ACT domain-containing protein [Actinomycetota bacterium]
MKEFVVNMEARPGRLAALTRLLGAAGVNIEALTGYSHDGVGTLRIIVDDATSTKRVLRESAIGFTEHAVLTTSMAHRPGELGRVTGALADADIGIDAIYVLRTDADGIELAICVEDAEAARNALPVRGSV